MVSVRVNANVSVSHSNDPRAQHRPHSDQIANGLSVADVLGQVSRVFAVVVRTRAVGRVPRRPAAFAAPATVLPDRARVPVAGRVGVVGERVDGPALAAALGHHRGVHEIVLLRVGENHLSRDHRVCLGFVWGILTGHIDWIY